MKKIISTGIAFTLALLLVNGVMFIYERPVAWIDTPNGPSRASRNPQSILIHGTEGYSISKIDSYGFTNQDYALNDEYVLMMGASHSQGKEMAVEKRYSSIVNTALVGERNTLSAFNISCDGHFLPSIINHFSPAVITYPNAKAITIEIGSTDFSVEELKNSAIQPDLVDTRSATELFGQQGTVSKIKNLIKENIPFLSMMKSQIETNRKSNSVGGGGTMLMMKSIDL